LNAENAKNPKITNVFISPNDDISENRGIKPEFQKKNISQRVKHFNEVTNRSRFNESGKSFEINVFNTSLGIIVTQLKERFLGLQSVVNFVSCLLS
jgi:hypothetical protein